MIGADGEQLGIMSAAEAQKLADEAELDLVKIAPTAKPPVCKIVDYGKYKYEQMRKEKESKKKHDDAASSSTVASISEISSASAGPNKIQLWIDSVKRFLNSVRGEIDRVTWPSWKELRSSTIVVVLTLLLVSAYMGVVDWVLSLLFGTPKTGF